jgi:hypothetical protein
MSQSMVKNFLITSAESQELLELAPSNMFIGTEDSVKEYALSLFDNPEVHAVVVSYEPEEPQDIPEDYETTISVDDNFILYTRQGKHIYLTDSEGVPTKVKACEPKIKKPKAGEFTEGDKEFLRSMRISAGEDTRTSV